MQAFTAVRNPPTWWDKSKSLEYLERESEIDVNLIKAYYIEMALNAQKYNFIRNLYKGPRLEPCKYLYHIYQNVMEFKERIFAP